MADPRAKLSPAQLLRIAERRLLAAAKRWTEVPNEHRRRALFKAARKWKYAADEEADDFAI